MTTNHQLLLTTRINFLKAQGYCELSDAEMSELAFGNRFAYIVCGSIVAVAVATAHVPTLIAMTVVAEATFKKDARINIRLSSRDLSSLQAKALMEGMPY